jgi:hypothetical protein
MFKAQNQSDRSCAQKTARLPLKSRDPELVSRAQEDPTEARQAYFKRACKLKRLQKRLDLAYSGSKIGSITIGSSPRRTAHTARPGCNRATRATLPAERSRKGVKTSQAPNGMCGPPQCAQSYRRQLGTLQPSPRASGGIH